MRNGMRKIAEIKYRAKRIDDTDNWKFAVWAARLVMPPGSEFADIEDDKLQFSGDHEALRDELARTIYRDYLTQSTGSPRR